MVLNCNSDPSADSETTGTGWLWPCALHYPLNYHRLLEHLQKPCRGISSERLHVTSSVESSFDTSAPCMLIDAQQSGYKPQQRFDGQKKKKKRKVLNSSVSAWRKIKGLQRFFFFFWKAYLRGEHLLVICRPLATFGLEGRAAEEGKKWGGGGEGYQARGEEKEVRERENERKES